MVKMKIVYEGDLHTRITHGPSGVEIMTDAPKDNMGKGESFSPSDLVASAAGACMITIMGIFAKRHQIELKGTEIEVTKEMVQEPIRRIGKLTTSFKMPGGIPARHRQGLEKAALSCPVHKSLHPDIETTVQFKYPD